MGFNAKARETTVEVQNNAADQQSKYLHVQFAYDTSTCFVHCTMLC